MSEPKVVYTLPVAVREGTEIRALVTLQLFDGVLQAVAQPIGNEYPIPSQTPVLLRWLADAIEMHQLDGVPDGI